MKRSLCSFFLSFLFVTSFSYAQDSRQIQTISTEDIRSYLSQVADYAIIYSGRIEDPYLLNPINHPYLDTSAFHAGTLCYNDIIYENVMLRYDMYRENILAKHSRLPYGVELNKEKVSWAIFNGYKLIVPKEVDWTNVPDNRFLILLHEDTYPVIKIAGASLQNRVNNDKIEYYFNFNNQYYICVNGVCYPLKNKRSILDLFLDKKRELNQYIKQVGLNFRKNPDVAFVELTKQYARLSR